MTHPHEYNHYDNFYLFFLIQLLKSKYANAMRKVNSG
jgi:hypothetical protein